MTWFTIKYLFEQQTIAYEEKEIERGMEKLILHQFSLLKSLISCLLKKKIIDKGVQNCLSSNVIMEDMRYESDLRYWFSTRIE